LCKVLKKADYAEGKMQASISGLGDLNLLDIDQDNHHNHNDEMKM